MASLVRKSAAVIAAYVIALHALLSGFALAGHLAFDPLAVICSAHEPADQNPSPPDHGNECESCLPACHGAPGVVPAQPPFSPVVFSETSAAQVMSCDAPRVERRHQPQASRAPPLAS
jgi:hypothetical protein